MNVFIYEGRDGLFYWRMKSRNHKVIADGSEGYSTRSNARRAAKRLFAIIERGCGIDNYVDL
jgi:uncharacterized protein YegP (UPF0339 family)